MKVRAKSVTGSDKQLPHGITGGMTYVVLGIEADEYRLLNDEKEPVLYAPALFDVVDEQTPACWLCSFGPDGEKYAYPPELNEPGFFEDYHDGVPSAVVALRRYADSLDET